MQPEVIGGRYRVESEVGRGGMGTVWACRDEVLQRVVAVKQVGRMPGESLTDTARALREARSSAGLSHPHVVTVYDVVEEAGEVWLVMELVRGRSLSQILKQDGPLDPAVAAEIGAQVADGLVALHRAGTVHRDVKPGNVLVREDGVAKISDFGIARTEGEHTLTLAGSLTGTPSYFSPELARGGTPSPGDDVWALGATLYAAVEGAPPYATQSNPVAVLHEIVTRPPEPPRQAGVLAPALDRMLDRDPASRWSMADAAHVLRRVADGGRPEATLARTATGPAAVTPTSDPHPAPAPAPDRPAPRPAGAGRAHARERRRWWPAALVLLLVVAVLGGAWALGRVTGGDGAASSGGTSASPSSTPSESTSGSPSPSASASPSTSPSGASTGSPSASPSGSAGAATGAAAKEQLVRDYFAAAPGGTDAAWAMLGPSLKAQGRASYDRFWSGIESVEVLAATARPGSDLVDVTLRYRTTGGATSTERKTEGLVEAPGGGYLLDTDTSAG